MQALENTSYEKGDLGDSSPGFFDNIWRSISDAGSKVIDAFADKQASKILGQQQQSLNATTPSTTQVSQGLKEPASGIDQKMLIYIGLGVVGLVAVIALIGRK